MSKSGVGGLLVIVPIYPASSPFSFIYWAIPRMFNFISWFVLHFTVIVSSKTPLSFGVMMALTWRVSPDLAGCLSKDGRAQPQVVAASSMTNGLFPVFVNRKTASLLSPIWIVPSCMDASSTFTVVCICEAGCFPVISFRYSSRIFGLWIGFPITTTLLYLSNRKVWNLPSAGKWFSSFSLSDWSRQIGLSKLSFFNRYRISFLSSDWKKNRNGTVP